MLEAVLAKMSYPKTRWLPLVFMVSSVTTIAVALLICDSQYSGGSSASGGDGGLPAISTLGSEGSLPVFGAGFFLMTCFLGAALLCRAAQLNATTNRKMLVWVPLIVGCCGIPAVWVMGFISDDSDIGDIHFIAAGVGMGLIGISGLLHGLFCLCLDGDRYWGKGVRVSLYVWNVASCISGLICFGVWFVGDKSSAVLEWMGFFLVLANYATYLFYFWGHANSCQDDSKLHVSLL